MAPVRARLRYGFLPRGGFLQSTFFADFRGKETPRSQYFLQSMIFEGFWREIHGKIPPGWTVFLKSDETN
jgi:hypothetical protein